MLQIQGTEKVLKVYVRLKKNSTIILKRKFLPKYYQSMIGSHLIFF